MNASVGLGGVVGLVALWMDMTTMAMTMTMIRLQTFILTNTQIKKGIYGMSTNYDDDYRVRVWQVLEKTPTRASPLRRSLKPLASLLTR